MTTTARILAAAAAVLVLLIAATVARADADPASDVLPKDDVFLPIGEQSQYAAQLKSVVAAANAGGFKIKVAVIATSTDLGGVPVLFNKPAQYAKYLGAELRLLYKGRLLIVMPAGFGLYRDAQPTGTELSVLDGTTIGPGTDGLVQSATAAVKKLDDRKPPTARAKAGTASRGSRAVLRFSLADNSGLAGAKVTVARGKKTVASLSTPVGPLPPGGAETLTWRVPAATAAGTLSFCVVALDPAGNKSKPACAPLKIA